METKQEVIEKLKKEVAQARGLREGVIMLGSIEAEFLLSLLDAEGTGKWVKVSERLPKETGSYLTYPNFRVLPFGYTEHEDNRLAECENSFWEWNDGADIEEPVTSVTHWQPLPSPPTE